MAAAWWFYHLERTGVADALAPLVVKCLEREWRVLISSPNAERLSELDDALWTRDAASFIPHGLDASDELDPARQPVLLSREPEPKNAAQALVLLDGQSAEPGDAVSRCMVMFDGGDAAARAVARDQFKAAKASGAETRYFQQTETGGWTQKA